jgi:hypothetical protein
MEKILNLLIRRVLVHIFPGLRFISEQSLQTDFAEGFRWVEVRRGEAS